MGGDNVIGDPEYDFALREDMAHGSEIPVGLIWNKLPAQARREILDESGIVDLVSSNLQDLANNFEILLRVKWEDLPETMRNHLQASVRIFLKEERRPDETL